MSCSDWKTVKLEEVVDILGDGLHGTPKYSDDGEYYFINGNNLDGKIIVNEKTKRVGLEQYLKYKKDLNDRTLLVSINGTLGKVAEYGGEDIILGKSACYFNVKKDVNKKYIKYILLSDIFKHYIHNYSTGTTIKNLGLKQMRKFKFPLPNIEEQEKIANILSSLDDKIELNNEMNKTLEEMAQSIFKRWFIDFEFPNEDGQPYKSSGGEMVESELGMIPNGWEVSTIYDLAEYINGTSFKSKDYGESGLPIIKIAELKNGITESTKFFLGNKDEKFYLKNRDILFSWSGNPDTSIDTFIWYKGDAILNQHIFKVIPKDNIGYSFIYLMLKYLKKTFTEIARNKQTTGLGHVTVKDLKNIKLAIDYNKVSEFNSVVDSLINQIIENYYNNEILNTIKNSILPKLMNGKIKLK